MKTITAQYNKFIAQVRPFDSIRERIILARPETVPEVGQKTAPFDGITEWRKLEDVVPELVHGVIALLSANCSEASVERSFSQQKLTHSELKNRKLPATVERQMFLKWNEKALTDNPTSLSSARSTTTATSSATSTNSEESDEDEDEGRDPNQSDTDVEIFETSDEYPSSDEDTKDVRRADATSASTRSARRAAAVAATDVNEHRSVAASAPSPNLNPIMRQWTTVERLSPELDHFCRSYIRDHSLTLPHPFKQRGVMKLRRAMESDATVSREQPGDAQKRILDLLQE
jgi:hypothetical protein